MQKNQQINEYVVKKPHILIKTLCFMTPWGPLEAVYTPLVVRFRPGHLSMTHGSPKHSYREPADHLEAVQTRYCKAASKNG